MRSRTYAFIPWMTATTATRKPTDTMIPSSVKNDRSLWLHAVWSAWRMASERGMALKPNGKRDTGNGKRACRRHTFPVSPFPFPVYSYLSASTGSNRAALLAGYRPKPIPVRADAPSAATIDHSGTWAGIGVRRETVNVTPPPTSIPTAPPTRVRVEASTRNCHRIARLVHRLLLGVGGSRRDREPHQSPHIRHVFDERAVRDADERGRRTAEQVRRRHVDADHLERGTRDMDRLADRVAPAEQLLLEFR